MEEFIAQLGYSDYELAYFIDSFCTSLDWDKDGDILTVAHDKNGNHNHLLIAGRIPSFPSPQFIYI